MRYKEMTIQSTSYHKILNKYKNTNDLTKLSEIETFKLYLSKHEKVTVDKIQIKKIMSEKRLYGNTLVEYDVYD